MAFCHRNSQGQSPLSRLSRPRSTPLAPAAETITVDLHGPRSVADETPLVRRTRLQPRIERPTSRPAKAPILLDIMAESWAPAQGHFAGVAVGRMSG